MYIPIQRGGEGKEEEREETRREGRTQEWQAGEDGNGFRISNSNFIIRAQTRPCGSAAKYGPIRRDIPYRKKSCPISCSLIQVPQALSQSSITTLNTLSVTGVSTEVTNWNNMHSPFTLEKWGTWVLKSSCLDCWNGRVLGTWEKTKQCSRAETLPHLREPNGL